MKNFLPALNLDIRSTSTFEAFVWEEEARKHEWYEDIQCEWIEYFKSQLKISFTKRIQEIDSTPHLSYMKTPGWNVFDFFKTYSFPESKINFSEEWYRRYHPEEYQDLSQSSSTIESNSDTQNGSILYENNPNEMSHEEFFSKNNQ